MICIYKSDENIFTHNGLAILNPITAYIEEELNGVYQLHLTIPYDHYGKWKEVEEYRIIKANQQLFRIQKVTPGMTTLGIYATHIFYDLADNYVLDTNIVEKSGALALNQILNRLSFETKFTATSDILSINNARIVRKNALNAIMGSDDNAFINRWGGELYRDNFFFSINERVGKNKGFKITYTKNMTGFSAEIDMSTVATRLIPIAYDGLMLPEVYLDSENIHQFPHPIIKELELSDIKVKSDELEDNGGFETEEEAFEVMRTRTEAVFKDQKLDQPSVNYKINFVSLSQTEEYKQFEFLETVGLGDDVIVYHKPLDIHVTARCIKYRLNLITNHYDSIELGTFKKNLSTIVESVTEEVKNQTTHFKSELEKAKQNATNLITNAMGGFVYKTNSELFIMDTDDLNTAVKVWRWNINGLGYSRNGINGPYEAAMTMDGAIVANMITAGILNANLIRAGAIKSVNDIVDFNLDGGFINFHHTDGTFTQASKNGLYRYRGNSGKGYHYLTYIAEHIYSLNATQAKNFSYIYTVPEDFQDKMFYASCSVAMITPSKYNSISIVKNFSVWANRSSLTQYQVSGRIEGLSMVKKGDDVLWDNGEPEQIQLKVMVVLTA